MNSLSLFSPDHILLYVWPDSRIQSFDCDQVHFSSQEIFQIEAEVHEVSEGRLFELHQYVDIAGLRLLPTSKGAKKADALYGKAGIDISAVASEKIERLHILSSKIYGFMTLKMLLSAAC